MNIDPKRATIKMMDAIIRLGTKKELAIRKAGSEFLNLSFENVSKYLFDSTFPTCLKIR